MLFYAHNKFEDDGKTAFSFPILPFLTMKMQLVFPYALTRNPLEIHIAIEGLQGVLISYHKKYAFKLI